MSLKRKILLGATGTVLCLLAALLILPLLFVDQIEARVRAEIESATRVRVSWSDAGLTFFRDFPHPTLSLGDLAVVGTGEFDGDTLAAVGNVRMALDVSSVFGAARGRGPLVVRSVWVDRPSLRLQVDDDGITSWDILPDRDSTPGQRSGGALAVSLRSFEVRDGDVLLDNAQSGLFLSLEGLHHSLGGDFSRESLTARTRTTADAVTVRLGGAQYLTRTSMEFDADFDVDMNAGRARLIDNELRLNDLALRLDGDLARDGDDLALDLTFEAPSTAFSQVLSLASAMYTQDFASLVTSGTFSMNGHVQGSYGPAAFPSFALELTVTDGSFRYPDLPLQAKAIAADLSITNPGGDLDSTVVDLSRMYIEIDDQPLTGALTLRTPLSDPDADVFLRGTIDLGDVARTVKLDNAEGLGGVIVADARMRARRSDVDSARFDQIEADGTIEAREVTFRGPTLRQPVDVREAMIELTPRTAELRTLDARLGSSDLQATGRLDNLLGFALGQQPLRGTANVTSQRFVLDEWKSDNELAAIPVPATLDLTIDGTVSELVLNGLEMTNARGRAIVRDQRVMLENVSLQTLGGRIGMDGYYETLDATRPTFAVDLELDSLDLAGASAAFLTVRTLAPVARYARGTFSSELNLSGALGQDLAPALDVLDGAGSVSTSRIAIQDFPLLDRLEERLQLQRLSNPTVDAVRSNVRIQGGRLFVDPFQTGVGGLAMTVSGSNGIDQSVDYTLGVEVPRAGFADAVLTNLASRAGPLGAGLAASDPVRVAVRVTGTAMEPSLTLSLSETTGSMRGAATQAAEAAVGQRIDEAQARIDASETAARARARAQADSIVAEAQRQADVIRVEAGQAAAEVRAQGDRAADELLARATNPIARRAAQPAADRLRREADERATALEREAEARATTLVSEAQARADALVGPGGGPG